MIIGVVSQKTNKRIRFLEGRIAEQRGKNMPTTNLEAALRKELRLKRDLSIRRWGHYHFTGEHIAVNERVVSTCGHSGNYKTGVGFCLKHTKIVPRYNKNAIDTRTLDMDDKDTEEIALERCVHVIETKIIAELEKRLQDLANEESNLGVTQGTQAEKLRIVRELEREKDGHLIVVRGSHAGIEVPEA